MSENEPFLPNADVLEVMLRIGGENLTEKVGLDPDDRETQVRLVARMVASMPPDMQQSFFERFKAPWKTMLLVSDIHPNIGDLVAQTKASGGDILLIASPAGPPPPAIVVIEQETT